MIKGTINIPDYYGKIESIESHLQNGAIVVNKSSGQRFIVIGANYVTTGFYAKILVYKIQRKGGTYIRQIDSVLLKKYYWKAV